MWLSLKAKNVGVKAVIYPYVFCKQGEEGEPTEFSFMGAIQEKKKRN